MTPTEHLAYLGLGSNLGDGVANLRHALHLMATADGIRLVAVASFVESDPWGFVSSHRFTNTVAAVVTTLTPEALLDTTQGIERAMGRLGHRQAGQPYEDRIIDIDILTYDDLHQTTPRLTLPHPHIEERAFVSEPLAECRQIVTHTATKENNH